jgi:polyisoprenoid-binding protein YceI
VKDRAMRPPVRDVDFQAAKERKDQMSQTQIGQVEAARWKLDPEHTLVEFSVKHMMVTTVRGRFHEVEGAFDLDADAVDGSAVAVRIGAASVDTGAGARDEHLRSGDFFDVESHPYLEFHSRRIEGDPLTQGTPFRIVGELTIRGVTREVVLDARFEGAGVDPWGQTKAAFTADTKIDRRDFGLNWNQALEAGGLLVSNEVRIHLEVQATPAEGEE